MSLEFVGKDPGSAHGDSPAVWLDRPARELVLQGWTADAETRADCLKDGDIPGHEQVVRLPARMIPILRTALERLDLEVTKDG